MSALSVMAPAEFKRYATRHADNPLIADEINAEIERRNAVSVALAKAAAAESVKALKGFGLDVSDTRSLLIAYAHIKSPMAWYGVEELPAPLATLKTALHTYLKAEGFKLDAESIKAELA